MKYTQRITSEKREFYYHCVTRVVAGEHLFCDHEKAVFSSIMRKVADFCGIDILTHCVMSNHIHILCRVPPANYTEISDIELLRRYRVLFSNPSRYRPFNPDALESLLRSDTGKAQKARRLLLRRMHNISMFMKILKLRMSIWFNKSHRRFGTLWAEKFKSIIVEGRGNPLLRMAQYIDLNPVRAGIVDSPDKYPFCGIADAANGNPAAQQGIERIAQLVYSTLPTGEAVAWYLRHLAVSLQSRSNLSARSSISPEIAPTLPLLERQECFSNSLAMGSKEFMTRLMNLFSSAFRPRLHLIGPRPGGLPANKEIFFGRSQRSSKS